MRRAAMLALALALALPLACGGGRGARSADVTSPMVRPLDATAAGNVVGDGGPGADRARVAEAPPAMDAAAPVDAAPTEAGVPVEPLVGEARERDPRSETVTIKLIAEARRQAHVFWGRKDLGVAPLEITRPRGSGPLDLVVLAPGCLPFHTRAFTDRDDQISLRLYTEGEAPGLLGYRPTEAAARPPRP